jgi:hypothetical protein
MKFSEVMMESKAVQFYASLKAICNKRNLKAISVGKVDMYSFLKIVINEGVEPTLLITGGIHGDEPAGPYGILQWLKEADYPDDLRIIILPMLNPTGFDKNDRNNEDNRDLNRGFNVKKKPSQELELIQKSLNGETLSMLLSLHEDRGHGGIYLYHADVDEDICRDILTRCAEIIPITKEKTVYGDKCDNGMIYIELKNTDPKHAHSLENTLQSLGIGQITFETPALAELSKRIGSHALMIQKVIENFNDLV